MRDVLNGYGLKSMNIDPEIFIKIKEIFNKNSGQKLKDSDIINIFERYSTGKYTVAQLTKEFGLNSQGTINFIFERKTWKDVCIEPHIIEKVNYYYYNRNGLFYSKRAGRFLVKKDVLTSCINNILLGKSLNKSAEMHYMSASFLWDILIGSYWRDVEVDQDLIAKLKQHDCSYSNFR